MIKILKKQYSIEQKTYSKENFKSNRLNFEIEEKYLIKNNKIISSIE